MVGKKRKRPPGIESPSFEDDESGDLPKHFNVGKCLNKIAAAEFTLFLFIAI